MITSKDVFAKRKAGEIEEAYRIALQRMGAPNKGEWDDRAFGWCLIDLIKRDVKAGHQANLAHYRQQLEAIVVPYNDDVLTKQRQFAISLCNQQGQHVNEAKQLSKAGQHDRAAVIYRELLQYTPGDRELSVSLGWELYRLAKKLPDQIDTNLQPMKKNLNEYLRLNVEKPSLLHSVMLQMAAKFSGADGFNMAAFCRLWNLDFLRTEDWERFRTDEGKELPALAERVIQQASKEAGKSQDPRLASYILPYLDQALGEYSDNIWLFLNKAKVLLALQRNEDAFKFALDVARAKSNDYWIWELLGDICGADDPDLSLSCYCKALLCSSDDRFSVKVRGKLAKSLVERNRFPEAKFEINRFLEIKRQEGNKVPPEIEQFGKQDWYSATLTPGSNDKFYKGNAGVAESALFSQLPWISANVGDVFTIPGKEDKPKRRIYLNGASEPIEVVIPDKKFDLSGSVVGHPIKVKGEWDNQKRFQIFSVDKRHPGEAWDVFKDQLAVVDNVNRDKKLIHFLVSEVIDGIVPFSELDGDYSEGDVIRVRLSRYSTGRGERFRVLSVSKALVPAPVGLKKEFQESISVHESGFAFTSSDVFLPAQLVTKNSLRNGDFIKGMALLSYNKKRSEWGWKAFKVMKNSI
jgi:hypothetical protein|tara:strand:+ start:355 stop:2259 length:1905 start_codon:yes stop_codon:yes gene_type:complete